MTSIEWYNDIRPALARMQKVGRHAARGAIGGVGAVLLIAFIAFCWNASTDSGLVRALGGITIQQLADEIAAHPVHQDHRDRKDQRGQPVRRPMLLFQHSHLQPLRSLGWLQKRTSASTNQDRSNIAKPIQYAPSPRSTSAAMRSRTAPVI